MEYYSEQQEGPTTRTEEEITPQVWGGIVAHVEALIDSGAFGEKFPLICPDGNCVYGTDRQRMGLLARAEIPSIEWPLRTQETASRSLIAESIPCAPPTLVVLDFIQFCFFNVAEPSPSSYHSYFKHNHLTFNIKAGQKRFRESMNRILTRNRIAYELQDDASIVRLTTPELQHLAKDTDFFIGDDTLIQMLQEARTKFDNPDPMIRKEAVDRLWDSWERLKTLDLQSDKKQSASLLLDMASPEPNFRAVLESEARALTDIGNKFHIRHSETSQTLIEDCRQIDYLFHRLLALIVLILKKRAENLTF